MRDRFKDFISKTIAFETGGDKTGAYTNDPRDSGKETKWGISKAANPSVDIKTLTYRQAETIYREKYWVPALELIKSEMIAFKLFDMGVLMGPVTVAKIFQKSVIKIGKTIKVDGKLGPMTTTAANVLILEGKEKELYLDLIERLKWRIRIIVLKNLKNKVYVKGWLKRILWMYTPVA